MRFREFLALWEDAAAEVAKVQGDIAKTDAAINQRTMTLKQRREQLVKQLALAQRKAEQEANLKQQGEEGKDVPNADGKQQASSSSRPGNSSMMGGSGKTSGIL